MFDLQEKFKYLNFANQILPHKRSFSFWEKRSRMVVFHNNLHVGLSIVIRIAYWGTLLLSLRINWLPRGALGCSYLGFTLLQGIFCKKNILILSESNNFKERKFVISHIFNTLNTYRLSISTVLGRKRNDEFDFINLYILKIRGRHYWKILFVEETKSRFGIERKNKAYLNSYYWQTQLCMI